MAKRRKKSTKSTSEKRGTNWLLIGGLTIGGVIILFALLYLALQEPETQTLAEYCESNSENCATLGAQDAPITLVEVSDFGCPHCQNFHQNTAGAIKDIYVNNDQVKWVFLPYALRAETVPAANAAMCANEEEKYYEFAEALFNLDTQVALTRDGFLEVGAAIGLDEDSFTACLIDGRYNSIIGDNQAAARSARVTGTPTFFINGQTLNGAQPFSEFQRVFESYLNS